MVAWWRVWWLGVVGDGGIDWCGAGVPDRHTFRDSILQFCTKPASPYACLHLWGGAPIFGFRLPTRKVHNMPDDKSIRHPEDGKRIDINDPSEVDDWCESLKCTKSELKAAVRAVGTSASEVRKWLKRQRIKRACRSLECTESELKAAIEAVGPSTSKVRQWLKENKGR